MKNDLERRKDLTPRKATPAAGPSPKGEGSRSSNAEDSSALSTPFPLGKGDGGLGLPSALETPDGAVASSPITGQYVTPQKFAAVLHLRENMTSEEGILWKKLRNGQLKGFHFRRQQLVFGFIADFYCHKARLVIEVDGGIHKRTVEYDQARDQVLAEHQIRVLRFSNAAIHGHLLDVLRQIEVACQSAENEENLCQNKSH